MNAKKFSSIQNELDQAGHITEIRKAGAKQYNYILNFQIILVCKQRRTIKNRIIKLYKTLNNGNGKTN